MFKNKFNKKKVQDHYTENYEMPVGNQKRPK